MSGAYTPYHPRWYRRRVSVWWWLENRAYAGFVVRELTSVPVALFALLTLWQLRALAEGPEAWARLLDRLGSPSLAVLSGIGFVLVIVHSLTWFHLAPKAMVVRLRGKRLPDAAIVGANYAGWLALSAVLAALVLRG